MRGVWCMYVCMCVCMYVCMCGVWCMYVWCMYVCMYVRIYVCMRVCMCGVCMYVCMCGVCVVCVYEEEFPYAILADITLDYNVIFLPTPPPNPSTCTSQEDPHITQ